MNFEIGKIPESRRERGVPTAKNSGNEITDEPLG